MTLKQLLARWRQWMDDTAEPYLHTQEHGVDSLNAAMDEACTRGKLMRVSASQALTVAQQAYTMPAGWFDITAATHSALLRPLTVMSLEVADQDYPRWRDQTGDIPEALIVDITTGSYSVTPIPTVVGTLTLHGYRVPVGAERFTVSSTTLEPPTAIPAHKHMYLAHWACHLAFLTRDADAGDDQKAQSHAQLFADHFGEPVSAKSLRIRQQTRGQRVTANWF